MKKQRIAVTFTALMLSFGISGCSSSQEIQTTDGKVIITKGKPQIDKDTGLVSYTDAKTGVEKQINRNQIINMSELDY